MLANKLIFTVPKDYLNGRQEELLLQMCGYNAQVDGGNLFVICDSIYDFLGISENYPGQLRFFENGWFIPVALITENKTLNELYHLSLSYIKGDYDA